MATDYPATRLWLARQTPEMLSLLSEHYARFLSLPIDQEPPSFQSDLSLQWVYKEFHAEIKESMANRGSNR